jgi:N-acetylglucosamine-6-phosphate deacetylase
MSGRVSVVGGRVVSPGGVLVDGAVEIDAGRVVAVGAGRGAPAHGAVVDAGGGWIVPGFLDLQVNGGAGVDVTSAPERIGELAADLVAQGVTAFLPTLVTAPASRRATALSIWTSIAVPPGAATPLGLHFEGPMISPARLGAHPAEHVVAPSPSVIDGWSRAAGVAMVTLAPERPGGEDVIARLVERGVVVAIGHTDATAAECRRAVDAGATALTHLFNAMRPFGHRDPGPVGATLGGDDLVAGLICDGVHVDDAAVRMAWRALGPERLHLVTDAVAARGGPAGTRLGAVDVTGRGDGSVRTADGVLAGSLLTLDDALRHLVAITGCSLPEAVATVTSTPAALLGVTDRGVLRTGAVGDVVVLDGALRVRAVVVGGEVAWRS